MLKKLRNRPVVAVLESDATFIMSWLCGSSLVAAVYGVWFNR